MTKWFKNIKLQITIGVAAVILGAVVLFLVLSSPEEKKMPLPPVQSRQSGFTFFGVGETTVISDNIKKALKDRLGSGVLEKRGTIDLRAGDQGFLSTHFPEIYTLHTKLNDSAGARIEHNIIKLTYRYALKKDTPFFYVELVFSNDSKRPLFFRIKAKKEAAGIIDEIEKKYGKPREIPDTGGNNYALSWEKDNDLFIIFKNSDRFGDPEFLFMIYFSQNIKELVATETRERIQREEIRKKAVRKAF